MPGDRANVTAARNAGVNLAFFTGNLMWWKTRWAAEPVRQRGLPHADHLQGEPGQHPDRPGRPADLDREWRDPRFSPPARRRTAGERTDWPVVDGQLLLVRRSGAVCLFQAAILAKYGSGQACSPARPTRCPPRRSVTSGTETWTMDSGQPARSTCRRHARTSRSSCWTSNRRHRTGRRLQQPDAVPGRQRRARLRCGHRSVGVGP